MDPIDIEMLPMTTPPSKAETIIEDTSSIPSYDMFDISTKTKFKNKDFILKFSNQSNLKFFKDELTIKYSGKGYNLIDYATVQSNYSISKNDPIFYFEIEIVEEGSKKDITIGFSDKEVVLNKQCGTISKSYGYNGDGKIYHDSSKENFGPKFKKGDIIGCGFYFSKNSIFYTYNGKLIDYAFKDVENATYFATISLHSLNECVRANFGRNNYSFDIAGFYIWESKKKISKIVEIDTSLKDLDYIVREYLVHSGYEETFNAIEKSTPVEDQTREVNINENDNKMIIDDDADKVRKYSNDEAPGIRKRTLSFMLDRLGETEPDIFKIMNFLQERKIIQNMINEKAYDEALSYFTKHFGEYSSKKELNYKKIIICLITMKYFNILQSNDYMNAFEILNNLERSYWNENLNVNLYDQNDKIIEVNIEKLSTLICYQNISETEFNFYLNSKQIDFLSTQINSLILEMIGLSNESILEKIMKQQKMLSYTYNIIKNSPGEKISVIIN